MSGQTLQGINLMYLDIQKVYIVDVEREGITKEKRK